MPWGDEELNHDGPVALWFQIADRLREAIDKGEFLPGDLLPSESSLNQRFGVSRTTSRAALNFLEQEGRIRRRSGRGSIVLPALVDQPLDSINSFAEDMQARGHRPGYRSSRVSKIRLRQEEAAALRVPVGSRGLAVERLLLADDEPIASSRSVLNLGPLGGHRLPTARELDRGSLYAWLDSACGIRLVGGEEFIEASVADEPLAISLGIAIGAPLLIVRRAARDRAGTPIEYVVTRYRADRYRLKISLLRR